MMKKEIRLERLRELSYMLKNHKKLFSDNGKYMGFDISAWSEKGKKTKATSIRCGSAACALGSAALHKPFIKQGLSLKNKPILENFANLTPCFGARDSFEAGSLFFGISDGESGWLFGPGSYKRDPGPSRVAKRVDYLIKHYTKKETPSNVDMQSTARKALYWMDWGFTPRTASK